MRRPTDRFPVCRSHRRTVRASCIAFATLTLLCPPSASAQDQPPSLAAGIVKSVLLDPSTYAPAIVAYGAMRLDWESSQPLFRNGYLEHNARYTVSGFGDSAALSHRMGNRKLATDSLAILLQLSLVHNLTERFVERALTRRYPSHGKVIRVIGRIERIVGASYLSVYLSSQHLRQWQRNERLARQLGYK